jgi:hypothetical protein
MQKTVELKKRLQFAAALLTSSNESIGTTEDERLLDSQILEVRTRSASSWGMGSLLLTIEVRAFRHGIRPGFSQLLLSNAPKKCL